jgi:hypothetical protein
MKYAHVTVYPDRIEWRCREHALVPDEGDTITGTESSWRVGRDVWGRVMEVLTMHKVNEMEIRYEE